MPLSSDEVRFLRTRAQYLYDQAEPESLREVVRSVCGINAQRPAAMMLSLRARIQGLEPNQVEEAIAESRYLVRTWAMRGTIHLLDAEEVNWMVVLLGPVFIGENKRRRSELGLGDDVAEKGLKLVLAGMHGKEPMTRWEAMDILKQEGFSLDRKSQAPIHLIRYAALQGKVCLGPYRQNGEPTYVLLDQWVAGKKRQSKGPREQLLGTLIGRYLKGYGPASVNDFAAWSGIPVTEVKEAWNSIIASGDFVETSVEGRGMWFDAPSKELARTKSSKRTVRLLPAFDSYLLAYANRDLVVPKDRKKYIYHGGQTLPGVAVDGEVAGTWRYERQGKRLVIDVSPFQPFDGQIKTLVSKEADDIGRFLGLPVSLFIGSR